MKKVIIIGAGASGVLTAIYLKKYINDIDVIVLEQNNTALKKLTATGNGRCNLSNKNIDIKHYEGQNIHKIKHILDYDIVNEFYDLGILTKYQGELLYPRSEQAVTVKNCLLNKAESLGVLFLYEQIVQSVDYSQSIVHTNKQDFHYNELVFAMGSPAGKLSGTTFDRYKIFEKLNLKVNPLIPSLVQMKTNPAFPKLKGVRVKGTFTLMDKMNTFQEKGELLFTDDGVSGIAVMLLSRYFKGEKMTLEIDMFDDYSEKELFKMIDERLNQDYNHFYDGLVNNKLASFLEKRNLKTTKDIVNALKHFKVEVIGLRDESYAQVLRGGLALEEVDSSLEIMKYPHLYAVGEVLDVAGDCGGYNLHFAFASGYTVAKAIERKYYAENK
ncbi:MAG: aminoacetone oxidase family FAD-binding enzyme [Bacilli bacterium]|nr:aminoacetone oxidase family FAD-binding enzyme [Bacilli bacterium]